MFFDNNFSEFCQMCKLLVHRKVLQKRNGSVKFIFLYHCRSLSQRKLDFGKKKLLLSCQNCFHRVQRKNWLKNLQKLHYCYHFPPLRKTIWEFCRKNFRSMSKLPFSGSDGTFAGKTHFRKTFSFFRILVLSINLSDTYWNCFGRSVNTTF